MLKRLWTAILQSESNIRSSKPGNGCGYIEFGRRQFTDQRWVPYQTGHMSSVHWESSGRGRFRPCGTQHSARTRSRHSWLVIHTLSELGLYQANTYYSICSDG